MIFLTPGLWSCKSFIFNFFLLFKQILVISHGSQQGFLWNTVIPPLPSSSGQFSKTLVLMEVVRLGVCLMMDKAGCPWSMTRLPYSGQSSIPKPQGQGLHGFILGWPVPNLLVIFFPETVSGGWTSASSSGRWQQRKNLMFQEDEQFHQLQCLPGLSRFWILDSLWPLPFSLAPFYSFIFL